MTSDIFSNDEEEKNFMLEVSKATEETWDSSTMEWNTIHGILWQRCDMLGKGSYGAVYLGMRDDGKLFAVKSTPIEYPTTRHADVRINCQITEMKMMRLMRSKYIVRCLGCGRSTGDNGIKGKQTIDVFLEYVARGSLEHIAKARNHPFEETPYIRQYTYDVLKALQYMKTKKIVHGDIKMGNLLLADDCVKLADWGGAKQLTGKNLKSFLIGTLGFKSPEVLDGAQQGHPADVYSLGCTVIEMLTGNLPKKASQRAKAKAKKNRDVPQMPQNASPECQDFLRLCLQPGTRSRWTAAELLHHPFITNRDKTSTLPYDMPLPELVAVSLLRPPRQNLLEFPDEPMTARVQKHLRVVSTSWMPSLRLCRPAPPPAPSPSPPPPPQFNLSRLPMPEVLPLFAPELCLSEDTRLFDELAKALRTDGSLGAGSSMFASPPREPPGEEAEEQRGEVPANPAVAVREFKDTLLRSAGLMDELNDQVYAEAVLAARQPLPDGDGDGAAARGLFPNDPNVSRAADPAVSHASKRRKIPFGAGCAGSRAVDALQPGSRPAVKGKRKM